jgi:hypothetical protein
MTTKSRVAELVEADAPPLWEPGPMLSIDGGLLTERDACSEYSTTLLNRLSQGSGKIAGHWSLALALWLAAHEPAAAEWLRAELGLAAASSKADLRFANLGRASLRYASLVESLLDGAHLWQAELEAADLHGSSLVGVNLEGARLFRANLDGANLSNANLQRADLCGAFLRGARLDQAVLWQTNLVGAHLEGAQLASATLGDANLDGAFRVDSDPPVEGWRLVNGRLVRA